jgi:IS605 OrfB family transposase
LTVYGVDRNEQNLTFGNREGVVQIGMSKSVQIRQATREIVGSFKRNDVRVRKKIASRYWKRAGNRTAQLLHAATNLVIRFATKDGAALALEDITGIRKMYQKKNGKGAVLRFRMNSWPFGKVYRQLDYKSDWNGVTFIPLTKDETRGSSIAHWSCGERLRKPERGDQRHRRELWCNLCKVWVDRDVNAAIVLSTRGLPRFGSSLPRPGGAQQPFVGEEGLAGEAMKGNGATTVPILRVDASKLLGRHGPRLDGFASAKRVDRTGFCELDEAHTLQLTTSGTVKSTGGLQPDCKEPDVGSVVPPLPSPRVAPFDGRFRKGPRQAHRPDEGHP